MKLGNLILSATFLAGCNLSASILTYSVSLSGPNEFPPNSSPGVGNALVSIDTIANTLTLDLAFSGLQGTTTASHIHCCTLQPGLSTAGVATTTPTFTGFPLGVTSGTYNTVLDLLSSASYNPSFVAAHGGTPGTAEAALLAGIASGEAYLNIHTTVVPGGEIRGFLVPEPATWALVGAALLGFVGFKRRVFA